MTQVNTNRSGTFLNVLAGAFATLAIGGTLLISELQPAWAQQAISVSRSEGPGEESHMFVMPAMPTRFDSLLRPDYSRRDVPLFHEQLNLDESQMYVLEVLMDNYTEQFQSAVDQFRTVQKHYRLNIPGMEGMEGEILGDMGEGMLGGFNVMDLGEGGEEGMFAVGDFEFVMESPGSVQIGVTQTVDVDATAGGESGAQPEVIVAFAMEDENGESMLSDEQLKEITDRISEQVRARLAEVAARRLEQEALREAAAAAQADGEAPVEEVPAASAEEVAKAGRVLLSERNRLRAEMVKDVTLLLNEEQKDKWPACDRTQRRISTMRAAQFAGEGVDVLRVLNTLQPKVENTVTFASVRDAYELALDQALQARNAMLPEHEIEMFLAMDEMMTTQSPSDEDRLKLQDRVAEARVAVRDANLTAAETIEPLLAAEDQTEFRDAVRREAYPFIYGASSTQQSLTAALTFEDLEPEAHQAITALAADYTTQMNALNDRWAAETRTSEPRQHRRMAEVMEKVHAMETEMAAGGAPPAGGFDIGALEEEESYKIMQERRGLNRRTMDQLRGLLNEEQIARLPKRSSPFIQHFGEGGPGGGGVRVIKSESSGDRPD